MVRSFLLLTTSLAIAISTSLAFAEEEDRLSPRFETNVRGGTERSIGMGEIWAPILQSEDNVLYGDARFSHDDIGNGEGNLGIGYREIVTNPINGGNVIVGGSAWLDRRSTDLGSTFYQGVIGGEMLDEDFDIRTNAYLPFDRKEEHITPNTGRISPYLAGSGIFYDTNGILTEEAQPGLDLELGVRVPLFEENIDSIRVYGGGYHFVGDKTENVSGFRFRAAADITEDIQIGARFQRDDERGSQSFLEATVRFPFGNKKSFREDGLRARLDESPERDIDIVTAAKQTDTGIGKPVLTAATGQQQRVLHVDNTAAAGGDGSKENPYNTLADARAAMQDYDVVYVHRGDGTTAGMDAGININKSNVSLIGSGVDFVYDSGKFSTGTNATLTGVVLAAKTAAPQITSTAVGITVNGDNTYISGIDIINTGANGLQIGLAAGEQWNSFKLDNVNFSRVAAGGEAIRMQLTSVGSKIGAIDIQHMTSNYGGRGINIATTAAADIGTIYINDVTVTNSGAGAINIGANAGGIIDSLVIENSRVHDNTGMGLSISSQTAGSRQGSLNNVRVENVVAENNLNNIYFRIANGNRIGTSLFKDVQALGGRAGSVNSFLISHVNFNSVIDSLTFDNVKITGSPQYGLNINTAGIINAFKIENSTFAGSGFEGIYVNDDSADTPVIDFGGGALGSIGNNSIYGNGTAGGVRRDVMLDLDGSATPLPMQSNWWGQAGGPLAGRIRPEVAGVPPAANTGTADTSSPLAADPN